MTLELHPDRLFPVDPTVRDIARELYASVSTLPIISPHGHVPPQWIAEDVAFQDPTSLLITPDHYLTRLLHASGVNLADLGVGTELTPDGARQAFRLLCENWSVFRGTPMRYWFESQLVEVFDAYLEPSATSADAIYDRISTWIAQPTSRPRALMQEFGIEFLATTDDPCDDLAHHRRIAQDASFGPRVVPTFRPDVYLEPARPTWVPAVDRLAAVSGIDTGDYAGWVAAMENRRAYFKEHGAVSTDHSHRDLGTERLPDAEAQELYAAARAGRISLTDGDRLRRHMVDEMGRMATEDGLTMTLHPAVFRNHHGPTLQQFGADVGADIPIGVEVTQALAPLLGRYGTHPNLTLVVFTIDESVYSRELAPLAAFYPALRIGVPWWFIDAPDAIRRFRSAVSETAGFTRTSGFIDDTRAFLSIPARHDMSRRLDCSHLAELVAQHRLSIDEAAETARYLVVDQPKDVFGI